MADVRRAAIIGTGTMGPGMGAVLARAGIDTALYDISPEALERAKGGVELASGVLERLDAVEGDGGGVRCAPAPSASWACTGRTRRTSSR